MPSVSIIDKASADRLRALTVDDVSAIHRLSALSYSARDIVAHIAEVKKGGDTFVPFEPQGALPKTVQAYSFLRDANQYGTQYGLGHAEASEWLSELSRDPSVVVARIHKLVSEADERKRGSKRSVVVTLEGAPRGKIPGGKSVGDDGGKSALGAIIHGNPAPYGFFEADPVDTNLPGPDRFEVEMGAGICVRAQSRLVAVRAARIVSVDGRRREEILRYVRYKTSDGVVLSASEVPLSVWDGRVGSKGEGAPVLSLAELRAMKGSERPSVSARRDWADDDDSDGEKAPAPVARPSSPSAGRQSAPVPKPISPPAAKPVSPPGGKPASPPRAV